MRHYLITGKDEGENIKPFVVNEVEHYLEVGNADSVRYYKEISKDTVIKLMRQGVLHK